MNTVVKTTTYKYLAAIAAAFLVAACGGGGGGGGGGGNGGGGNGGGGGGTANAAPTISGTPPNSVDAGDEYSFTPTAADADGDTLTFSIENAPLWAVFDSATGTLEGFPFSADIGEYADITIAVTDGKATATLSPFGLTVAPQRLGRANFDAQGTMTPTANGFHSEGTLVMDTGERVQEFENGDLTLEFDDEGKLSNISGEADLPVNLSDNTSITPGVRAIVGMLTGEDINATPELGIRLLDERRYFVFYVDAGLSLTIANPTDPSEVLVEDLDVPVGGSIVMIMDPTDPFLYRFGSLDSKGAYGSGQSFNALIPFEPDLDYPGLDSFNGHIIEKGKMAMKFKKIAVSNLEGQRVTKNLSFLDIDWQEPLDSPIEYRSGINGLADLGISIPIVGDFTFAAAEFGATVDVGLDRQQAALAFYMDAEATSTSPFTPDWFHVIPSGAFDAEATVNGTGEFELMLFGAFQSTVPPSDVSGTMRIDNDGVGLAATTVFEGDNLAVSLDFANEQTVGRVEFPESYATSITTDVSEAIDREIARVEQALQDLQDATADYEFEASLRGLREAIPPMMDGAITIMNGIPGIVYDRAYDTAINVMSTTCKSITVFGVTTKYCLDDVVNETSIATDIAKKARTEAAAGIKSGVDAMRELKARALEADDEQLREALRLALAGAYDRRTYSKRVKVTYSFSDFPFDGSTYTLYNETYTRKVLSDAQAEQIAFARDNVWRIQETSDIMIQAQQIYDQLPTDEVLNELKQGVQDGTAQVPIPEGLGYRAIGDTYDAFITVDGVDHVTDINVLRPSDVKEGVSDLLVQILLGPLQ